MTLYLTIYRSGAVPRAVQGRGVSRARSPEVHSETHDGESQKEKGKKDASWGFNEMMA